MKLLSTVIKNIEVIEIHGNVDIYISSVALDSSKAEQHSLFAAIKGNKTDGHLYIDEALARGSTVILHESDIEERKSGITYIKVVDSKESLGIAASNYYGHPSFKLKLIGVTGTNGKTTVASLLHDLFRKLGYKAGMIGTVVNKINDESEDAERTTPDSITLNEILAKMVDAGCEYCFMEVSSHAVSERRIAGINFSGGVFTNLTQDHLDYHHTFENYRDAKRRFFEMLPEGTFALVNIDDPNGEYMASTTKAIRYTYSLKKDADFTQRLETKLIGDFNAYNILAIYGTATILGEDSNKVKNIIKDLEPVAGRFQYIKNKKGTTGIVDYAHTPDALENVLKTIYDMKMNARVIAVVGCGGDRDKSKRPIMAGIVYDMSDILILTSDNPRTENPEAILEDMKKGIETLPQDKVYTVLDRRDAIQKACAIARDGDYILIAGKGHETYQEIDGVKNHFDDMEELKKYL